MPIYGIEAAAKAVTAVASITTAVSLWTLIPSALALPSPRRLTEANDALLHRIQERDDALKRLQEANRLLLLAEEMAKAGHWRLELPARNRVWSAGMRKIFGLADGSLVPNLAAEDNGYHEDDRDLVRAQLEAAILAKTPFTFEARILRPDSSCRTISARGVSKFDSEGAVRALFGVALDITELKQTEAKLRLRERQLQAVLDNMPALIGYWDQHLCNRLANSKYLDWYGKDPAAFLGVWSRGVVTLS
jgi:PAS domain S-box-containing protein